MGPSSFCNSESGVAIRSASVSVVIPYFNAEATIGRALDSIRAQTLQVKEIIIVNDGSDFLRLTELVRPFQEALAIRLVDLEINRGAAEARNVGVAHCSGELIAFLDSDDVWHREKISVQHDFMRRSGAFLSCHGYVFDLNRNAMDNAHPMSGRKLRVLDFAWKSHVFTPTVMVLKERFIGFDRRLSRSEDIKCWISNFANGDFICLSASLAGGYKNPVGQSGLSGSYSLMHREHLTAWRLLYRERRVSIVQLFCAISAEYIKYPIRRLLALRRGFS